MRLFLRTLGAIAFLLIVALAGLAWWVTGHQFSARATPTRLEAVAARQLRHLAMGREARNRSNPEPADAETIREGLEHFADHCAVCHANDGSGDVEMGAGLYPKPPDLRLDSTQSLTDGELFFIVENGIRFTGMPGWATGTPEGKRDSWRLVRFMRHLPKLSTEELVEMQRLNPRSFEEWEQEREAQQFLEGSDQPQASEHQHTHP